MFLFYKSRKICFDSVMDISYLCPLFCADGTKGFGGKFGVQTDRKDASAVGWDYKEKLEKHASQKGPGQVE